MGDYKTEYRGVEREIDKITSFLTCSEEGITAFPVLEDPSMVICPYTPSWQSLPLGLLVGKRWV